MFFEEYLLLNLVLDL